MSEFYRVLEKLRKKAIHTRDLGDSFERLMAHYLRIDPFYSEYFSNVWLWNDFPNRYNKVDTGVDLVARERRTGKYCAIQCKFFAEDHSVQKRDIDSFFTELGRSIYSSGIIVTTTDQWSKNAEDTFRDQSKSVQRLRFQDLVDAIDWSTVDLDDPERTRVRKIKALRPHQTEAHDQVLRSFKTCDRGQMIMACGTGKTFTSLRITESLAKATGKKQPRFLFLVPSISLLSQTLREWSGDAHVKMYAFAVCSDKKVTRQSEDIRTHDLGFPATTNGEKLADHFDSIKEEKGMVVVFSTYQSIDAVIDAQEKVIGDFDAIICDEAHRTTGVTLVNTDESHFVKVHNQDFIRSDKRLYMTATPKIYSDAAQEKAQEHSAEFASMDNEDLFGPVFHRLGFGEAVTRGLLSDYKVIVLAVEEKYVDRRFQSQIADEDSEIKLDDAVKITGCWNGLAKKIENEKGTDLSKMRRAVAFSSSIKESKRITEYFPYIVNEHIRMDGEVEALRCEVEHVDGSFNALKRNEKLDWLKETSPSNTCRILSNARCLTEGVDVPNLDAVMFLNPRNSVVDVVQAVGRVMRKTDEKDYGYIILPIGVPSDQSPDEALNNNEKYKIVWQVLQALRAHDDRFDTTVNQIDLNKQKPTQIGIGAIGDFTEGKNESGEAREEGLQIQYKQIELNLPDMSIWRDAIYAKIVQKVGNRRYWENWAKDVANIAERHITRIENLIEDPEGEPRKTFDRFLSEIQLNLNDGISQADAIEMLSQHMITKPVFDALFDEYSFVQNNPVSQAMQGMVEVLEKQALEKEIESLEKFYESVRQRARGVDNAAGKQRIIIELYDKFFKSAFPRTTDKLGIVYTPVEIVDFIIQSANDALKQEFGMSLSDKDVHILDPFTGTGTFVVRLLQSGLIEKDDLLRKYTQEIHANEIVLLAYYIAAINIEQAYYSMSNGDYRSFDGSVLTDTFQIGEGKDTFDSIMFPENNERVKRQINSDIRVIIGNPPYSAKQESENDNNQNVKYLSLDESIRNTYAKYSTAQNVNNLYDSYIRAIRWASNRIGDKGVICFVTNGSFLDGNAMDGMRKSLTEEFSSIYCFNLRGNARTSGEQRRKEKGNVFGEGTRTNIAITLLIKNSEMKREIADIYYYDIGDYLSREEKLNIVSEKGTFTLIDWDKITPNKYHDWINQRSLNFQKYVAIASRKSHESTTIFKTFSRGVETARDTWLYNFSLNDLSYNVTSFINFYNSEVCRLIREKKESNISEFITNNDSKKIKWSSSVYGKIEVQKKAA